MQWSANSAKVLYMFIRTMATLERANIVVQSKWSFSVRIQSWFPGDLHHFMFLLFSLHVSHVLPSVTSLTSQSDP